MGKLFDLYDVLLDYSGIIFQIKEQGQKDFQIKEVVRLIQLLKKMS